MRLGLRFAAAIAIVSGCAAADAGDGVATDDFIDMDTPPSNCSAGTSAEPCPAGGSSGASEGEACLRSSDCADDNHCVASFMDGEVGAFVCSSQCVPQLDESSWCLDSSACCEVGAVCSARGLCVDGALDGSGTAGDASSDGSGTATEGTDGSTGGTGSGSGSDTDGSTGTTGATMGVR